MPDLPLLTNLEPTAPVRKIFTQEDIIPFTESEPYEWIGVFVERLGRAVDGKKVEEDCQVSEVSGLRVM